MRRNAKVAARVRVAIVRERSSAPKPPPDIPIQHPGIPPKQLTLRTRSSARSNGVRHHVRTQGGKASIGSRRSAFFEKEIGRQHFFPRTGYVPSERTSLTLSTHLTRTREPPTERTFFNPTQGECQTEKKRAVGRGTEKKARLLWIGSTWLAKPDHLRKTPDGKAAKIAAHVGPRHSIHPDRRLRDWARTSHRNGQIPLVLPRVIPSVVPSFSRGGPRLGF